AESPVRLLSEHSERTCVDAGAVVGELPKRGVGLAGVRRAEMRDDAVRLDAPRGQRHRDSLLRRAHVLRGTSTRTIGAARPLLSSCALSSVLHASSLESARARAFEQVAYR